MRYENLLTEVKRWETEYQFEIHQSKRMMMILVKTYLQKITYKIISFSILTKPVQIKVFVAPYRTTIIYRNKIL